MLLLVALRTPHPCGCKYSAKAATWQSLDIRPMKTCPIVAYGQVQTTLAAGCVGEGKNTAGSPSRRRVGSERRVAFS
jgi:hypothetical protein